MSPYTQERYRYRYRPVVPDKAHPSLYQLRERGSRRQAAAVVHELLQRYLDREYGGLDAISVPLARHWIGFAYQLGRDGFGRDPDGDEWRIRRVWHSY